QLRADGVMRLRHRDLDWLRPKAHWLGPTPGPQWPAYASRPRNLWREMCGIREWQDRPARFNSIT
ncbi:MAG: hypothetical protein M3O70_17430, partial [Actinomycetota bacterium]|nr:hypothetical protein [Actinomycetota bacterium]